jgi:hypothetical protein
MSERNGTFGGGGGMECGGKGRMSMAVANLRHAHHTLTDRAPGLANGPGAGASALRGVPE